MVSSLTFDIWQGRHRSIQKKSRRQEGRNLYSKRKKCTYVDMWFFFFFFACLFQWQMRAMSDPWLEPLQVRQLRTALCQTERLKHTCLHISFKSLVGVWFWRWNVTPCEDPVVKDNVAPLYLKVARLDPFYCERKLQLNSKENKQFYPKTARNGAKELKRPFSKVNVYM